MERLCKTWSQYVRGLNPETEGSNYEEKVNLAFLSCYEEARQLAIKDCSAFVKKCRTVPTREFPTDVVDALSDLMVEK